MKPVKFGKYTLLDRISHGGMAEVFRAKTFGAAGFERTVAIKLLLPNMAMDQDFVTMLIDEAKIAGQLSHANIAQIFDLGMAEGRYYIVQEFVDGLDLRAILKRLVKTGRKLSVSQACHIILKICEGLDYAHNKRDANGLPLNLVHRDISPQNILVSMEGEVKLIDFGIAKAEGRATRTLAGLVKGKFAYMSPEQIRGLPVDRRSDVFATGIVFHELLTTRPLFRRKSEFETLKRTRSGKIDPPSAINPDVPLALDDVVLRGLARHVEDRYESALQFRDALWDFVRGSGHIYSRSELSGWMARERPDGGSGARKLETSSEPPLLGADIYPEIEVSDPLQDGPTVVDASGARDFLSASGELDPDTDVSTDVGVGSPRRPLVEVPGVEVAAEALREPQGRPTLVEIEAPFPVAVQDQRPTLLVEPRGPLGSETSPGTSSPVMQLTTADISEVRAMPDSAPVVRDVKPKRTILAASVPLPVTGERPAVAPRPGEPQTLPAGSANVSSVSAGLPPPIVTAPGGPRMVPRVAVGAPVGDRPLPTFTLGPRPPPAATPAPLSQPTPAPLGEPTPGRPGPPSSTPTRTMTPAAGSATVHTPGPGSIPPGSISPARSRSNSASLPPPVAGPGVDRSSGGAAIPGLRRSQPSSAPDASGGTRLWLVLAMLVLVGALAVTITLVATGG